MNWANLITELLKLINNLFGNPKKQMEKIVKIHDFLHEIIETTSVERVLVLKAHNGGGIIKPTGELYSTALYEDYTAPFKSSKSSFQKFPVDKQYVKMLLDVIQQKKIELITNEMEDSKLKDIYITEGVMNAKIYYLRQDKKCIYYMSVASSEIWPLGPQEDVILDILVNKIQQNIK